MNRKIIITGGSRGIGAACVRRFCQDGDRTVFIYRSNDAAAQKITENSGALHLKYDISDYNNAEKALSEAICLLGGCDVLVNCAGIAAIRLFTEETQAECEQMLNTNLQAVLAASRVAARSMLTSHSGCIINVGSVWGARGASCEVTYSASKAALRGFTSALAKELGPSGIRVNCVEPGVIDTEMNACLDEETRRDLAQSTALCRLGFPEEVAEAVFFLASRNASFITGAVLPVDGGFIG